MVSPMPEILISIYSIVLVMLASVAPDFLYTLSISRDVPISSHFNVLLPFLLVIFFIYNSDIIHFHTFSSTNQYQFHTNMLLWGCFLKPSPTPASVASISLHWLISPTQYQRPPLPLMPNKAVFCCIFNWSYGSHHVYSLVGRLWDNSFLEFDLESQP